MELHHYNPDDLPLAMRWQILSFLRTWDTAGFVGRLRGRRWISRPEFNPVHFVLMDDDFLVGHVEVVSGKWAHRGTRYGAYGISGVFVYPDYQHAGHGTELIHAATDYIAQQPDADIGLIWCAPSLGAFYQHCGWELMDTTTTLLGDTEESAKIHAEEILFMRFFSLKGRAQQQDFENSAIYFGWTTW